MLLLNGLIAIVLGQQNHLYLGLIAVMLFQRGMKTSLVTILPALGVGYDRLSSNLPPNGKTGTIKEEGEAAGGMGANMEAMQCPARLPAPATKRPTVFSIRLALETTVAAAP